MATVTPIVHEPDFLTLYDLAALLGVSYSTVFVQLHDKTLPVPVVRVGRRWLVPREAYDDWKAAIVARGSSAA